MCGDGVVKVKRLQIADFSPRLVTLIGKFANLFGTYIAHGNTGIQFISQPLNLIGGFLTTKFNKTIIMQNATKPCNDVGGISHWKITFQR